MDESGIHRSTKFTGILNEEFKLTAVDGIVTLTNTAKRSPLICDHTFKVDPKTQLSGDPNAKQLNNDNGDDGDDDNDWVVPLVVVIVVLCVCGLAGAGVY